MKWKYHVPSTSYRQQKNGLSFTPRSPDFQHKIYAGGLTDLQGTLVTDRIRIEVVGPDLRYHPALPTPRARGVCITGHERGLRRAILKKCMLTLTRCKYDKVQNLLRPEAGIFKSGSLKRRATSGWPGWPTQRRSISRAGEGHRLANTIISLFAALEY